MGHGGARGCCERSFTQTVSKEAACFACLLLARRAAAQLEAQDGVKQGMLVPVEAVGRLQTLLQICTTGTRVAWDAVVAKGGDEGGIGQLCNAIYGHRRL